MRERERECRERNRGSGSSGTNVRGFVGGLGDERQRKEVVSDGTPQVRSIDNDSTSFCITNILDNTNLSDLWKLFAKFGK